ncbi:MBL fold metallo-hydrolase [Rhodoferax saidenbachensis]|uniref:Glyoxylase-like metal-dependent hydrolase (Beta-lactamase superfamily II) n=1 Tax=Rhodoferax saidenbachensis TaxID=1484693 RepID=A0ABU1ZRC2_9BURK|nr:MBL fold metallo-hydrolase [Rhodoferax saidenbachensis]MDR7308077.1 glyoxylase-like metal-dependent hydrolase (beta-lactamase superfamily II) [Rhodoferax saidenbachensis]
MTLPDSITVLERGWLSSNNILIRGSDIAVLIDSGYCTHAEQTLALVETTLQGRPLDLLLNTHLHSDHCGGNAALQARYPALHTLIPPGHAEYVRVWDAYALSYTPTGQQCPQFRMDGTLEPGTEMRLGDLLWQVHAAPGHDPHSVILFEPASRTLVSADALWERGFGVVFPELDGEGAFDEVAATLDLIERLNPATVIPGHGAPFADAPAAIAFARQRLNGFVQNPAKHLQYAAKVLLKFKLLEAQQLEMDALLAWAGRTPFFASTFAAGTAGLALEEAAGQLVKDLVRSGAATVQGSLVLNA